MRIQHNIPAVNAHRMLGVNNASLSKNLEKLSSGYKINRAGDDAAGLAISEKMRAQITGLDTAQKNAQDGISLVQTAEGALTEVHSMLNRMTELAGQAANGTYQDEVDRENAMKEMDSLKSEIDRISEGTNYNGIKLLDGSLGGGKPGSAGEAIFTGGSIAKFEAASQTGMGLGADLSTLDPATAGKDYFSVDGQKFEIDWSQGDAKSIADLLTKDFSTSSLPADQAKDIASKLTNLFNDAMKEQGVKGTVKVTSDGTNLIFASTNNGAKSEFSFLGSDTPGDGTEVTSVGAGLFGRTADDKAVVSKATKTYNGDTLANGDSFIMEINGVKSEISLTSAVTKGTTALDATLETMLTCAIEDAVDAYNTTLGLTAGTKDSASGLTGLTKADFAASFNQDGQLVVKYTGDVENVKFSFSDVGDKSVASSLGLSSRNSTSGGTGLSLQIGDTAESFNQLNVSVASMSTAALGLGGIDIGDQDGAKAAVDVIKKAINQVSSTRGDLGAIQNRLEHTINNLGVTSENMTAAESRIRDVDMAKEMMTFTKNNILNQASQAMLAQANQLPQGVLQLLQ